MPTIEGTNTYDGASSSSTHSVPLPTGTADENWLIEIVTHTFSNTGSHQTSGSTATGYTERTFQDNVGGFDAVITKLYKIADGTESGNVTVTLPASKPMMATSRYVSAVDTTTPFDIDEADIAEVDGGNNPNPGAITTNTDGALVCLDVGVKDNSGPGTPVAPSGYAVEADVGGSNRSAAFLAGVKATAGVENPGAITYTCTNSTVLTDALRPAPAGGGILVPKLSVPKRHLLTR